MHTDQINEVWTMLDRERLAGIVRRGPAPIFATISGAHLYGFASTDSDIDLRGAVLLPARALLGLRPLKETLTRFEKSDIEVDWVAHDVRKFARMMTKHNGYVLEQLYSPLVVLTSSAHVELRKLGKGCVTRPTVRHYKGFLRGRRKRLHESEPTVKDLLYAYRVVLTGIHLMRSGEVEANTVALNEVFRLPQLGELIERKQQGTEKMRLDKAEIESHDRHLDELEELLEEAHSKSWLPEEPTSRAALEDFVIRLRLDAMAEDD